MCLLICGTKFSLFVFSLVVFAEAPWVVISENFQIYGMGVELSQDFLLVSMRSLVLWTMLVIAVCLKYASTIYH